MNRNTTLTGLLLAFLAAGILIPSGADASLAAALTSATSVAVTGDGYSAEGTLTVDLAFAPVPGTNLTLVNNTGPTPIKGTFTGVPQGGIVLATYKGTPYKFVVNYFGNTGNEDAEMGA